MEYFSPSCITNVRSCAQIQSLQCAWGSLVINLSRYHDNYVTAQKNTQIRHTQVVKNFFMVISPSEGSHADYWSKSASMTLALESMLLSCRKIFASGGMVSLASHRCSSSDIRSTTPSQPSALSFNGTSLKVNINHCNINCIGVYKRQSHKRNCTLYITIFFS